MLYAIYCQDGPGSLPKRASVRGEHLAYVQSLVDEGRLILAGPHPSIDSPQPGAAGYTGSLIIAEFDDLAQAQGWAAADPYAKAGVFLKRSIKPFIQTLP